MNDLEREYLQNVERAKRNEERRRLVVMGIGYALAPIGLIVYLIADDFSLRGALRAVPVLAFFGIALAIRLTIRVGPRLVKSIEDRRLEVTTTERERAYRQPIVTGPGAPRRVAPVVYMIAMIPLGVASLALSVLLHRDGTRVDSLEASGIVAVMAGIILVGQRVYRAWRVRRNARLELKWERWLDSADSCQVGPRKWTK